MQTMARRTTAAKTGTTKKSTAKKATPAKAPGKPASRKTTAKKPAGKTATKTAAGKASAKAPAKTKTKPASRKTAAKKPAAKAAAKKPAAKTSAKPSPKPTTRKTAARKNSATKTAAKTPAPKTAAAQAQAPAGARVRPALKARTATDAVLGQIVRLMMASPKHRHMFLSDMEVQVIPPLRLGQCRVLRNSDGQAFAYASWARVSDDVHARLEAGERRLRPGDWNSGPNWWLIDIVAPQRAIPTVMAELQKHVFKDAKVRTLVDLGQ